MSDVIEQVKAVLAAAGDSLNQAQVARQSGISEAVLSALIAGNYKGNVERNIAKLAKWLKTRVERNQKRAELKATHGESWLPLPTSRRIEGVLKMSQALCSWGLVYKGAGVGKTSTALHYQQENSNVWIFTADPFRNNEMAVLQGLCGLIKIDFRGQTRAGMSSAIIEKISHSEGLLIIDEAQYLSERILNGIRVLTENRIGVVLLGNDVVRTRMSSPRSAVDMNPVWSRVIGCLELPTVARDDITHYLKECWGIEKADLVRYACDKVPQSKGALRSLKMALRVATSIATSKSVELGLPEFKEGWRMVEVNSR